MTAAVASSRQRQRLNQLLQLQELIGLINEPADAVITSPLPASGALVTADRARSVLCSVKTHRRPTAEAMIDESTSKPN